MQIVKLILKGYKRLFLSHINKIEYTPTSKVNLILGSNGSGKALKYDTLVRIPNGWKMISLLKVGDLVMSKDGTYTKVNGVYPQGKRDMYRITFRDGRFTDCDIEHLWEIYDRNLYNVSRRKIPMVINTEELIKRFENKNKNGLYIDLPEADTSDNKENLLIDPYLLGVLIGDGCLMDKASFSTSDEYIVNKVKEIVTKENLTVNRYSKYDYAIVDRTQQSNRLVLALEYYGLFKKYSHEKFIPKEYMESSIENRLALLNGLMDTDGTVGKETPSYSTSSLRLAKDIQLLIRSLGGIAYMGTKETHYTKGPGTERIKCRPSYRISIRYKKPKELFTLPRQLDKLKEKNQYSDNLKLRINSIVKLEGKHEAVCIAVDHPSKLYVVKDYIVTHNTSLFKELSPLPADMKEFDEDGYKEITIIHNNDTYLLTSGVVATNKHSFKINDIELNPAGTKKVQLSLVKEHFNLTPEIHTVMLGLKGFTNMSVMERKNWLTNISTVDYTYAISVYNKLKQRNRDIVGAIKISQSELSKNTSSILTKEDKESMLTEITMMRDVIKSLLESKTNISNKITIDDRYIIETINLANNLIKQSTKIENINPKNIDNVIYNTINNIKLYKDKIIELENILKELDYLENTVSFNNIELETMIVNKREEITKLTDSLYLDIDIKNINEYKTLFEYTYSKIYEVLLEIVNNTVDDYTINEYKSDMQKISDMKTIINTNIVTINKLELDKSNMEHNRDHNGIECNKCGNQWSIGFNETEYRYLIKKIEEFTNKNIDLDNEILDIKNRTDVFDKKLDAIRSIQNMFTDINLKPLQTTFKYLNDNSNIMLNPNKTIDLLNNINNDLERWKEYPYLYNELEELYKTKKTSDEKIAIELKHHNANKSKIEEEYHSVKNMLWVNSKNLETYEEYKVRLNKMREVYKILVNFVKASNANNKIDIEQYRLSIINETVTMLDMEVSKLENKITESNYNERLIEDNKNKVIELNKRKEVTDRLMDCMSPSNGLIGKSITNFLNVFTKDMNEIINSIWNYNIEILPCNITDTNDLDYRFEVLVDNRNKIEDVSKTSSSMQEIIDLAFKIVSMKYLRMENGYLLLDEFGRTFDTVHAKNAYDIVDILANSSFSNVFIISHFEGTYGRFKNADISVLNNENLLLNKDIEINKVMKIS